jgi:hypothetical protein
MGKMLRGTGSLLHDGSPAVHEQESAHVNSSHRGFSWILERYAQILSNTWLWELACLLFSVACLVSLVAILQTYNGQPNPQLSYGLTLNTIISILTTASKSSLIVTVTACISQLKWQWFHAENAPRGRDLLDLQLFDCASRGPWGSSVLLIKSHTWSLVSVGALVTVVALGVDAFAQQLITYPLRNYEATNLTTPTLRVATLLDSRFSRDSEDIVSEALWNWNDTISFTSDKPCPSGNCVWEDISTLGFCSSCEDITSNGKNWKMKY